jgi:hypothetical protein
VNAEPHVMLTKIEEQLSIPVSMLNNIIVNKNSSNVYIFSQTVQTSRHERTESVFPEWFKQKWKLYTLMFLAYVNDIWRNIEPTIRLFTDDCIIYGKIMNKKDMEKLQI